MSSQQNALWLVPVGDLGGVARHVLDATTTGIPGWRIVVLCPEGPFAEALREQGAVVIVAQFGTESGISESIRSLRTAVRTIQPQIVHSHLAYADFVSSLTPLPGGVFRVSTEHGIAGDASIYHKSPVKARIMALAHAWRQRRFVARIAVSEATARAMREKWGVKEQVVVIPNGVDVQNVSHISGDQQSPRILSLSRLAREKRLDRLIDAFAVLQNELPGATLTIAGSGSLENELREYVIKQGLNDSVRFPGHVDPIAAMAEADIIVQLSVWENASYTLLDAVARGIPAIASRVGGNPEILPPNCLVDPGDVLEVVSRIRSELADQTEVAVPGSVSQMTRSISKVYGQFVSHDSALSSN